jgi:hypothetical protein
VHRRLAHALAPIDRHHDSLQRLGSPAGFLESWMAHGGFGPTLQMLPTEAWGDLLLSYNESDDCFGKPDHKVFQSMVLFSKRFQRQIFISFKLIKRRRAPFLWRWLFHSVSTLI